MTEDPAHDARRHVRGRFQAHGDARVQVRGRVMHFTARGPWNAELIDALNRTLGLAVAELPPDGRFVDIIELHGNALMTPDALARLQRLVDDAVARGYCSQSTALVLADDVEGRALMLPKLLAVYQGSRPTRAHRSLAEAEAALAAITATWA